MFPATPHRTKKQLHKLIFCFANIIGESNNSTQNGTLADGNMDLNLLSPGGSILTHTHTTPPNLGGQPRAASPPEPYKASPTMGWFLAARCARIWWRRPRSAERLLWSDFYPSSESQFWGLIPCPFLSTMGRFLWISGGFLERIPGKNAEGSRFLTTPR